MMNSKYNYTDIHKAIPDSPILLNPYKHHLGFISKLIQSSENESQLYNLREQIVFIGNSLTDLYTGSLSPDQIYTEIKTFLIRRKTFVKESYIRYLSGNKSNYGKVTLSDNSFWILRLGKTDKQYIHIHPGKYSPNTIRVRSLTLKSAILITAYSKLLNKSPYSLEFVNYIRQKYLNESPLKAVSQTSGLGKIISLIY